MGEIIYFLKANKKFGQDNLSYLSCHEIFIKKLNSTMQRQRIINFESKMLGDTGSKVRSIDDIDLMNGSEFEKFIATVFTKLGYTVILTKSSGDQGVDIIAEKNNQKIAIQAKCYSGKVSNKSIQEVVAGMKYYGCSKGMVITNSTFTDSAINLAVKNQIVVWDREMLASKIKE